MAKGPFFYCRGHKKQGMTMRVDDLAKGVIKTLGNGVECTRTVEVVRVICFIGTNVCGNSHNLRKKS